MVILPQPQQKDTVRGTPLFTSCPRMRTCCRMAATRTSMQACGSQSYVRHNKNSPGLPQDAPLPGCPASYRYYTRNRPTPSCLDMCTVPVQRPHSGSQHTLHNTPGVPRARVACCYTIHTPTGRQHSQSRCVTACRQQHCCQSLNSAQHPQHCTPRCCKQRAHSTSPVAQPHAACAAHPHMQVVAPLLTQIQEQCGFREPDLQVLIQTSWGISQALR
jgi:hypothetical protein